MGMQDWQRNALSKRHRLAPKLLIALSLGATGGLFRLATLPTPGYSLFTSQPQTITVPVNVAQASLAINGQATTIGIPITNMVPGQVVSQALTLDNKGNVNFGSIVMQLKSSTAPLISTGALELGISECTGAVSSSSGNVTCAGETQVVPITPISTLSTNSPVTLTSGSGSGVTCSWGSCTAGGTSTMLVSIELASSAPQSVYGTSTNVDFSITAEGS
jgi:hypothetical protein